jgi:hypothetical protein
MIYLRHTTDLQRLYIPKDGRDANGGVFFKAISTVNQVEFSFYAAEENDFVHYHHLIVELAENIPSGEYEYTLSDEDGVLSTGLLVIGEMDSQVEYVIEKEYEQYEE